MKLFAFIVFLGFLIYANTLHSSFHFDDRSAILENPAVKHLNRPKEIWDSFNTRFVTGVSFALNYSLGGRDPFGYHLFNILCHILNSLLVYRFVLVTLENSSSKQGPLIQHAKKLGYLASTLFLVHPIQTQAVNYLWQRTTVLAALFYLASLTLYAQARYKGTPFSYGLAWVATLFGMFTKEITFTLPLMLCLYEFSFLGPWRENIRKRLTLLSPFLVLFAMIPLTLMQSDRVTMKLLASPPLAEGRTLPQALFHMTRWSPWAMPRQEYLLTQANVFRTYLRLFFFPVHQNVDYDYPIAHWVTEPGTLFSLLLLMFLFLSALKIFKTHRLIAFCIFWFFITLSVESLFILQDVIFEHRLYLPVVGFSIVLPVGAFLLLKDPKKSIVFSSILVLILSVATVRRNAVWKDEVSLWEDVVKKSPKKPRGYNNLGVAYGKEGENDQAMKYYLKTIALDPRYAKAYNNIGVLYGEKGDPGKEMAFIQKAITLDPHYAEAYSNLGTAHGRKGDYHRAMAYYLKAITLDPTYAKAYNNLGVIYGAYGDLEQEVAYYQKSVELNPDDAYVYHNLGMAYREKGEHEKAQTSFRKAAALDPTYDAMPHTDRLRP